MNSKPFAAATMLAVCLAVFGTRGFAPLDASDASADPAERTQDGTKAGPSTVLPWNRTEPARPEPPQPLRSSAREMLDLYGIDESQIQQLMDGRPWESDEDETLYKVLYRLPFLGRERLERWRRTDVTWDELAAEPDAYRTEVFAATGRALHIQRVDLPNETAERLEFSHYYRVQFQTSGSPHPALICTRTIPLAWQGEGPIDQRAAFIGLFLKAGEAAGDHSQLVFAAERIAWHPDRTDPVNRVTDSRVLLGELGMDIGLFDDIADSNRKELEPEDGEAFYQMLAAVGRTDLESLWARHTADADLARMLTQPETLQGELVRLEGNVRRIQKIMISEEEMLARFGFDHYYQLDIFLPLGDQEVRLGTDPNDESSPVFVNAYPVTCCVLRLPEGLSDAPKVNEPIRAAGFYFKLWAYRTEFISSFDRRQLQIGPMFIAPTVAIVPPKERGNSRWEWMLGGAFLAILSGLALGVWLFYRSDRQFEKQTLRKQFEPDPNKSLDDMGIQANDGPDFSGLD